jgi:hypothetical protein
MHVCMYGSKIGLFKPASLKLGVELSNYMINVITKLFMTLNYSTIQYRAWELINQYFQYSRLNITLCVCMGLWV